MFVYRKTTTKRKEIYSINKNKICNPNIMYSKRKTTLTNVTTRIIITTATICNRDGYKIFSVSNIYSRDT